MTDEIRHAIHKELQQVLYEAEQDLAKDPNQFTRTGETCPRELSEATPEERLHHAHKRKQRYTRHSRG